MITFTVWGFIFEGGKFFDFSRDIFADTPLEATEKLKKQYSNLVVSSVCRSGYSQLVEY
jgi:hypothetical protein